MNKPAVVGERLSETERAALRKHERTIRGGLDTFIEVGQALAAIRNGRLYREKFRSFEEYCREKWAFSKSHANRLVGAAEVVQQMAPIGAILPRSEAQVRELRRLPTAEAQVEVWMEILPTATRRQPTAMRIRRAVDRWLAEHAVMLEQAVEPQRRPALRALCARLRDAIGSAALYDAKAEAVLANAGESDERLLEQVIGYFQFVAATARLGDAVRAGERELVAAL